MCQGEEIRKSISASQGRNAFEVRICIRGQDEVRNISETRTDDFLYSYIRGIGRKRRSKTGGGRRDGTLLLEQKMVWRASDDTGRGVSRKNQ